MYDPITITPASYVADIAQAHDLAILENEARTLRAQLAQVRERLAVLNFDQIKGDDHRLTEFWAEAQRLADEAGHCQVFDNLAEALGGPRRITSGVVCVQVTLHLDVRVEDISDYDLDEDSLRDHLYEADLYDIAVSDYTVTEERAD